METGKIRVLVRKSYKDLITKANQLGIQQSEIIKLETNGDEYLLFYFK